MIPVLLTIRSEKTGGEISKDVFLYSVPLKGDVVWPCELADLHLLVQEVQHSVVGSRIEVILIATEEDIRSILEMNEGWVT